MAGYSSGPYGGCSYSAPLYKEYILSTNLAFVAAPSGAIKFNRVGGQQDITVTDNTTGFSWTVRAQGGFSSLANGYIGYNYDPSANYSVLAYANCTVTPLDTNIYSVLAGDGRTYTMIFSPLTSVQPTISFDAGAAFVTGATIKVKYYRFIFS